MRSSTKNLLFFVAFEIVALVAFYYPWLVGQQVFYYQDSTHFFEPLCTYIGGCLREGRLPLWNAYSYCGMPQIAISSPSLFYPLNWIFAWLTYSQGVAINMIVSQVVCGLGAYLLVEALGWGFLSAALAGCVLAFNGYMFSLTSNYTVVATAAWFPLTIYFVYKLSQRPSWLGTASLALVVSMMLLCGRPEIFAPALLIVGALILLLFWKKRELPEAKRSLLAQVSAIAIALLVAAPVLIPSLEWLPLSRRATGLQSSEILMFSANWYDLLNVILPQPLGDLRLRMSYRPLVEPHYAPYFSSAFVGMFVLVLAMFGLRRNGGMLYRATAGLLVVALIAGLGANLPGMEYLVNHVSALSLLRFPSKLLFFVIFCLALLAARGLRLFLNDRAYVVGGIIACVVAAGVGALLMFVNRVMLPFLSAQSLSMKVGLPPQHLIGVSLLVWSLITAALLAIPFLANKKYRAHALWLAGVSIPGMLLYQAFAFCRAGAPPDFYSQPSQTAQRLVTLGWDSRSRLMDLIFDDFSIPNKFLPTDNLQATIAGYQYSRQILRPFTNIDARIRSAFGFEGAMVGDYFYLMINSYLKSALGPVSYQVHPTPASDAALYRMLQLSGTKFAITQSFRYLASKDATNNSGAEQKWVLLPSPLHVLDQKYFELADETNDLNRRIYRLKDPLPRAYFSARWQSASRDAILDSIYDAENGGFDPARMTLIEGENPSKSAIVGQQNELVPLAIEEFIPERLSVHADAKSDGLVVLCDQWYPGWTAAIDGKPAPILRCNGFMRAVKVQAGDRVVTFAYKPKSLVWGYIAAAVGLLCIVALLFGAAAPRRRSGLSDVV